MTDEIEQLAADERFAADRRAVQIDERALAVARRVVEDILIEHRNSGIFVLGGNGMVVRQADGGDSSILRLSTWMGLSIGIQAYLAALAETGTRPQPVCPSCSSTTRTGANEELRALLAKLVDPDPCWYDHHGDCQAHGTTSDRPCPHARAKELLATARADGHHCGSAGDPP